MQTTELSLFTTQESTPVKVSTREQNPQVSVENTLNSMFPTQAEENKISRTRRQLGVSGKELSDAQIESLTSEFQFLVDTWLDEFERQVFGGKTLKEVLNEG